MLSIRKNILLANFVMIIFVNSAMASEINLNKINLNKINLNTGPIAGCSAKSKQGFAIASRKFIFLRVPETVQTDHIDWDFRLANLYGTDYKYTFSNKLLSQQYLRDH
jgi:hypothetical protein